MNLHDIEHYDKVRDLDRRPAAPYATSDAAQRLHFGRYLCKAWNWPTGSHFGDDMLVTFEVVFFEVQLEPDLSSKSSVCLRTS